jgi:MFS family permease
MSPSSEIILIRSLSNIDRIKGLSLRETVTSIIGIAGPLISALVISYFGGLESADSIRPLFLIQFVVGIFIFAFEATQLHEAKLTRVKRSVGIVSHLFSIFRESPILSLHLLRECVMTFTWQLTMPFMGIYLVDVKGADQFLWEYTWLT